MPKYKDHIVHYLLDGYPLMMDALPESIAASSQQFAPKVGSASEYESDTLWSAGIVQAWDGGVGKDLKSEGFYFSTADTLRADAMLPPLRRYTQLVEISDLPSHDDNPLSGRAHYTDANGRLFVAQKRGLWEWNEDLQRFLYRLDIGVHATSMAYFDGYLHIAGKHGSDTGERDYVWVRIDDYSYGFDTPTGLERPLLFHVFGGLLYATQGNDVYYTGGSYSDGTSYPSTPDSWDWTGPIRVGSYDDEITGIAGLLYQELGQRYVYVSTRSHLHVILPGDVPFGLTKWPTFEARNGIRMQSFYNKIYAPVGGDLFAIQSNGDILGSGVDNNDYGLPCSYIGDHYELASAPNLPFVLVKGHALSSVWANKASGWHHVATLPAGWTPAGLHYSAGNNRLYINATDGRIMHVYLGNTARDHRYDENYRYHEEAVIDLGWYNGSVVEQQKYWHSVFCDAGNLTDDTTVEIIYLVDNEEHDPCAQDDYDNWTSAGFLTNDLQELVLANHAVQGKRIRVAAVLRTDDPTQTPVVRAIGVRYTPKILTRERYALNITLPAECLRDAEGANIEEYSQAEWNAFLIALKDPSRATPIDFVDLDNRVHKVLVNSTNRRTYDVTCIDGNVEFWIDWSLSLTEAT